MDNVVSNNNDMEVKTDNGAQNQNADRVKITKIRQVADGVANIPLLTAIENNYGANIAHLYNGVLQSVANDQSKKDPNRRKNIINLSALERAKENENQSPKEEIKDLELPKVHEEEKKTEDSNDLDKEYYLRILQRRIDLIEEKLNIKFDPELIEYFKSDEYFENGNIDFLESLES